MKKFLSVPVIYGYLILLGYINYYTYYIEFDINISPYLTSGELLLAFLNLSNAIVVFSVAFTIYLIIMILRIDKHEKKDSENEQSIAITFRTFNEARKEFKKNWLRKRKKQPIGKYKLVENSLDMFFGGLMIVFFAGYIWYFIMRISGMPNFIPYTNADIILLGCVFFIAFSHYFLVGKSTYPELRLGLLLLIVALSVFGFVKISNSDKAREVLCGSQQLGVTFKYEDEIITTSDVVHFVGRTEKYLFIRDVEKSKNLIFNVDDIKFITMKMEDESEE